MSKASSLNKFCDFHMHSLLLDGERWKQVDVPPEIQNIVERFETSGFTFMIAFSILCTLLCRLTIGQL